MVKWIQYYLWFWKESFSFMAGHPKSEIIFGCLGKAHKFATESIKWDKLTPKQKENWYLSGEGRVWEME